MAQISRVTTWASGQVLTASALNGEFNNIVNAWNNMDNGTTALTSPKCTTLTMAGNIAMASNKLTGLAAGTTSGDSLRYEQVLGAATLGIVNGGTNSGTTLSNGKAIVSSGGAIVEASRIDLVNPGTSNDTNYDVMTVNDGSGSGGFQVSLYSTTAVSSAKQIAQIRDFCSLFLIVGNDTTGDIFADLVLASFGTSTPTVITSKTVTGSPATRTYSQTSNNLLKLAMSAGAYNVTTSQLTTNGF